MSDRLLEIRLNRVPTTSMEWNQEVFAKISRYLRIINDKVAMPAGVLLPEASVTDANLRDSAGVSVIGRATSTAGDVADIVAGGDGQFLARKSGALAFGALVDADIPATIARDSEVVTAIAVHVALADPHPGYVLESTILNGSTTYDPPSLADGDGVTTTVTVTGAALGDFALASFSLDLQGITVSAYVSATNTVAVRFQNESGGVLDLGSGTLRARVWT